ncbi:MAG: hypothetical protein CMJ58_00135 [Planctomycetaceae bacterium]|nr:hypothetical protein [Planctomycetaceae bacterium]
MGKAAIDFSAGVADIDNALERMKRNEEKAAKNGMQQASKEEGTQPNKGTTSKPKKMEPKKREAKAQTPDPMVNKTFKVKHSRAEQFRRLVYERKLAGVEMATQQELLDEALIYVLDRYAVRSGSVQD